MKEQTIEGIEVVFTVDGHKYVVEYDLAYDRSECWADVVVIMQYGKAPVTKEVALKAFQVAQQDANAEWAQIMAGIAWFD